MSSRSAYVAGEVGEGGWSTPAATTAIRGRWRAEAELLWSMIDWLAGEFELPPPAHEHDARVWGALARRRDPNEGCDRCCRLSL